MTHTPRRRTSHRNSGSRPSTRLLASCLALGLLAAACSDDGGSNDSTSPTDPRTAQTAPTASGDGSLELAVASGDLGAEITVAVDAPSGAAEMQVGTDPSFLLPQWQPVADEVVVPADGGYQEVFARFRDAGGGPVGDVVVAGVDVDLAAKAATSDRPTPTLIGLSDPRTLSVQVQVGRIERGFGTEGDRLVGADVDPEELDSGWQLSGPDAPDVQRTSRDTRPTDTGKRGDGGEETLFPVAHRLDLTLDAPLAVGTTYTLTSPLGGTTEFTIDDHATRSPAVHANQVGNRPGDVAKVAYFSAPYESPTTPATVAFHVIDVASGASVFDGTGTERTLGQGGEVNKGDLTGGRVWALDYSALDTPGRYRVCVEAVGCSETFLVDEAATWQRVATTIARGLFHQRSGIALGAPFTSVSRPRPDHPDDGLEVHESSLTALEAGEMGDDELFQQLVAGATNEVVDDAWGGHFDAGDWDRRAQHLWMVRMMLDLVRVAPDPFATLDLNIPESGDAVPDVVDEALWTLDLFARMQRDDGAVRGGIESARFPDHGTPSWKDDLARYAYAPDPWSSYMYASAAADAAVLLRPIDADRAQRYADSATAAMTWAEQQPRTGDLAEKITAQRAVAAASMLTLTGDASWNDVFVESSVFGTGTTNSVGCNTNEACDAGWAYLWADRSLTDPQVVANVQQSFVDTANRVADAEDTTLYQWCLDDPDVPLIWGLGIGGSPRAVELLRAWMINGDQRFMGAAQKCASVSLGANPLDVSYVTGLGATPARHPLIVDVMVGQLPAWPGTPVYGPHTIGAEQQWVVDYRLKPAGATGDLQAIPYTRSWFDLSDVGPMNEFTVYQSHGPAMWVFGVLAGRGVAGPPA